MDAGYIYPKEDRPVRDLLRKRGHLVKLRTSVINSLQGIINRNCGIKLAAGKIKQVSQDNVTPLLAGEEDLALSGAVSKDTIDYLSKQTTRVERSVKNKVKIKPAFTWLQTIPGVGLILALTIMLETGSIDRFAKVGNFTSYCRKVPTSWTSNNKKKGKGNKKNGNKYLAWSFSEAAEFARRYNGMAPKIFWVRISGQGSGNWAGLLRYEILYGLYTPQPSAETLFLLTLNLMGDPIINHHITVSGSNLFSFLSAVISGAL